MDTIILEHSLYHINREQNKIELDNLNKSNAETYVNKIIHKSLCADNVRMFKPKDDNGEAICLITKTILAYTTTYSNEIVATIENPEEKFNLTSSIFPIIAQRLLKEEIKKQEKILHLTKLKEGSLIQAVVKDKDEDKICYILAKVEHIDIYDKKDWQPHSGVPIEEVILKTCVISYDEEGDLIEIKIFDSNNTIADYWAEGLLELEPITGDEENTINSYKVIDNFMKKNIKKDSPADYNLLRNNLIGYYNQNVGFNYEDLVEKVFKNYSPINNEIINMKNLSSKLEVLPNKGFDKKFNIVPKILRKRKTKIYNITDEIELTLKDSIDNLTDIIKSEKINNDEMYIKIKVDEKTFKEFDYSR